MSCKVYEYKRTYIDNRNGSHKNIIQRVRTNYVKTGIKPSGRKPRVIKQDLIDKIIEKRNIGLSIRQISEDLQITKYLVNKIIKKNQKLILFK